MGVIQSIFGQPRLMVLGSTVTISCYTARNAAAIIAISQMMEFLTLETMMMIMEFLTLKTMRMIMEFLTLETMNLTMRHITSIFITNVAKRCGWQFDILILKVIGETHVGLIYGMIVEVTSTKKNYGKVMTLMVT